MNERRRIFIDCCASIRMQIYRSIQPLFKREGDDVGNGESGISIIYFYSADFIKGYVYIYYLLRQDWKVFFFLSFFSSR